MRLFVTRNYVTAEKSHKLKLVLSLKISSAPCDPDRDSIAQSARSTRRAPRERRSLRTPSTNVKMAAVAAPVSFRLTSSAASFRRASLKTRARLPAVRARGRMVCAAAAKNYNITLLPGDGIGPEIMKVAKEVLEEVGPQYDIEFNFTEALVGGAAIDAHGVPHPPQTCLL